VALLDEAGALAADHQAPRILQQVSEAREAIAPRRPDVSAAR
jgi:hypothetical protein